LIASLKARKLAWQQKHRQ